MFEKIKKWWNGVDINLENNPDSPVFFIGWHNDKHWTSKLAHILCDFYLKHWQWIWGIVVAIIVSQPWTW